MFTSSKKDEMERKEMKETGRWVPSDDWVYYIDTRSLCNAAWAFAHLALRHDQMLEIISEEMCHKISDCSAQQLSMCAWSFAKMARKDFQLMQTLADEAQPRLSEFSPQHLMTTVWACAKLAFLHVRLLLAIANVSCKRLQDFTPQHLSITAWGMATLAFRHLPLMDAITAEAQATLRAFKPQNIANTAWAFATLGLPNEPFFAQLAKHSDQKLPQFTPQNLSNLVWSFATLRLRCDSLFTSAAAAFCSKVAEFDPQALSMMASTYASLKLSFPSVFQATQAAALKRLETFQARDLQALALGLVEGESVDIPVEALARRSLALFPELNSLDVGNLSRAFVMLRYQDLASNSHALLDALEEQALVLLNEGSVPSQALADFAYSFPGRLQATLAQEVQRKLVRHDLRHLVALEEWINDDCKEVLQERLGCVIYHILQVLPTTPDGWRSEDYQQLILGLKVTDFGEAATTFLLSKCGIRARLISNVGMRACPSHARLSGMLSLVREGQQMDPFFSNLQPVRQLRIGPLLDRASCCVFQIMEAALALLPNDTGRLCLALHGTPCVSCVGALIQFKQLKPDIDLEVLMERRLQMNRCD
ncbi:unnamed protein product [Durusdinium trenchii]